MQINQSVIFLNVNNSFSIKYRNTNYVNRQEKFCNPKYFPSEPSKKLFNYS